MSRLSKLSNPLLLTISVVAPFAGCLDYDWDGSETPPIQTGPILPHTYEWSKQSANHSWLSAKFQVNESARYRIEVWTHAVWENSSTYFLHASILKQTNGSAITVAGEHFDGATSCQYDPELEQDQRCKNTRLEKEKTNGNEGTLRPGKYLILARAYGATSAAMRITMYFEYPLTLLAVEEGSTQLLVLQNGTIPSGSGQGSGLEGGADWNATEPFLATFNTVGIRERRPNYEASHGHVSFQLSYEAAPWIYSDQDGRLLIEPSIPGSAGNWRFAATGGVPSPDGVAYSVVGFALSPSFVSATGELEKFGSTVPP